MTGAFRCSVASQALEEDVVGSASTVGALVLVETPGPWGVDAVRDSRLPDVVKQRLTSLALEYRIRPLLIRGHGGRRSGGTRVFAASLRGPAPLLEGTVLDDPRELLDVDLTGLASGRSAGLPSYDDLVFAVCTHGRHDACCAERGRPLCRALHEVEPEASWEVSHIGGDRFAPNLLMLPWGLYYGRVEPEEAAGFARTHRAGELSLPHLRGRCALGFAVQAAEVALRRETGERGLPPLRLLGRRREGETTRVTFAVRGQRWRVEVVTTLGCAKQLTCRSSGAPSAPLSHRVTSLTRLPRR